MVVAVNVGYMDSVWTYLHVGAHPLTIVGYLHHKIAISMSTGLCATWTYRETAFDRSSTEQSKNVVQGANLNAQTRSGVRWFNQ